MPRHLQRQIDRLKKSILQLGAMVEEAVHHSIIAVQERDPALAQRVIAGDEAIDEMEIDVEEECLHTLALYQPVAHDLRYVVAVLKINNDLERIADLAVNIAEQAVFLADAPDPERMPFDLSTQSANVQGMLRRSLEALINIDPDLAQTVRDMDDRVDDIHRQMYEEAERCMIENPNCIPQMIHIMGISRQLERIADHTVNVAEDVLYMAKGEIFRHGGSHHVRVAHRQSTED